MSSSSKPTKESFHILDSRHPSGVSFKILSVVFDTKLIMDEAVYAFVSEAGWRLRTLLRTRRFFEVDTLVRLYKSHILSFVEGATAAIYHAAPSILKQLDDLQESFLDQLGLPVSAALIDHNLAPLSMRRDIAMLGILFKVARGIAPAPIQELFKPYGHSSLASHGFRPRDQLHSKAIHDPVEVGHPVIIKRSVYGLIRIFNRLPQDYVDSRTVQQFQRRLQRSAKDAAREEATRWQLMFSVNV